MILTDDGDDDDPRMLCLEEILDALIFGHTQIHNRKKKWNKFH